jgi:GntR family transcriptional regulator, transcriptional repressor for pyruvate dehydrogenase complex
LPSVDRLGRGVTQGDAAAQGRADVGADDGPRSPRRGDQLRQPRLAELVASKLRNEILSGRLTEGDSLPRQEDLLADFKVSPPAVREALRILETEGLISVRRGNVGGAIVHLPTARGVAYMMSLVLQVQQTSLDDVGAAIRDLEPLCAALCSRRPDRSEQVVPVLRGVIDDQVDVLGDAIAYNRVARRFHETLVEHCGNETMILVIGGLESVWSAHERHVYQVGPEPNAAVRRSALRAHEKLLEAIEAGNAETAAQIARRHLDATQAFTMAAGEHHDVSAELVRDG